MNENWIRGSNPGPLRERRTCYRLLHSCGVRWCHVLILLVELVKGHLDGQYFCTIFEVAQWYWTFVGTIERLCNVTDCIKTFWNILRNLEILCRLWVVLRNILSVLLFSFSFLCLSIDYEHKMWRKSICYWMYITV